LAIIMKTVLVNKPIHSDAIRRLEEEAEVLTPFDMPPKEVLKLLEGVQGLILCAGLKISNDDLDRFSMLEVIGRHGVGIDYVDLQAVTERGIPLVFTPEGPTESTAEHAFLLMLAAARKLSLLDRATRAGEFHIRDRIVGRELRGIKVGVVGFGRIGKRFAEMCREALSASVYAFDPYQTQEEIEAWGAIYMPDLVDMASKVDVLSIHCPLTPETTRLVNSEVLAAMKPDAYLINTSRGAIVDEPALVHALAEGRLAGAGLDVYAQEPPPADHPLFALDNAVLTPHLASFTDEGRRRMGLMVVEDVLSVLRGERPKYLANPAVYS
jgi:D-3-phosphoglycerate dehydrogenase